MRSLGALTLAATIQRCRVIIEMPAALAACCVLKGFTITVIYIPYLDAQVKLFARTVLWEYAGGWQAAAYGWFNGVSVMP
jgi:hypothetical protein